jgi:DUF4097 and DUF4098 domain-containing protein YvlB
LAPVLLMAAPLEQKQTVQKTFPAPKRLEVENVTGSIHVTGYDGREVQLAVNETFRADTKEKLDQATKEIKLDIATQGDTLRIFVDGPYRCKCGDGSSTNFSRRSAGYDFRHEFEIRVPRDTEVYLRNVNGGPVKVENIAGNYDVENINGGVEMLEAAGSGRAYSLNGGLKVVFRRNPREASYFGSLNGQVDLLFQPDLSADLRMKTFNGHIYSDFDVTSLPGRAATAERRNGKQVYRADRFTGARVGNGGPEIKLDGFNGDIRIIKRK